MGKGFFPDELYVKVRGEMKYVFAMIDDETRFWIAQEVADTKKKHNASGLFYQSMRIADKVPATLITDGLHSYQRAFKKAYAWRTTPTKKPEHIQGDYSEGNRPQQQVGAH